MYDDESVRAIRLFNSKEGINKRDPAPDPVFVFIKISYKTFYNHFRVIRV